ncbi:hypothetical protein QTH90_10255 [Variovorax sp. J2P1-59]|uniref:hypothetical protein n=1 Tax=Variovorax flavidus TaxID=3053501 RepID=UPI0025785E47|nr:hypothetical protein [Variovorax sp. J2P1-59]MDM0074765.1 hypothetical protein [Variovorax sp. J2P1-59]
MNRSEPTSREAIRGHRRPGLLATLQGIAGTAAVCMTIAASSVVAASEALHEAPGSAVRALCDAFAQPHPAANASMPDVAEALADRGTP